MARSPFGLETPLIRRARRDDAVVRLLCVPHAGAGASYYSRWLDHLPDQVEPVAVQFPGREDRLREPPPTDLRPLVVATVFELTALPELPLALFGHSGGGLFAYEVAQALSTELDAAPTHLFVSSVRAPHLPARSEKFHTMADGDLARRLRDLGGIPDEVLDDGDLARILIPTLRSDFALWEGYEHRERAPLSTPVTAYLGECDPIVSDAEIDAWRQHTDGPFEVRRFPGGHFFLDQRVPQLVADICARLELTVPTGQPDR